MSGPFVTGKFFVHNLEVIARDFWVETDHVWGMVVNEEDLAKMLTDLKVAYPWDGTDIEDRLYQRNANSSDYTLFMICKGTPEAPTLRQWLDNPANGWI